MKSIVRLKSTDVSEELITTIFKDGEWAKQQTSVKQVASKGEMSVHSQQTTPRHILEYSILHTSACFIRLSFITFILLSNQPQSRKP
jgi:hypothetical protein